MAKKSFSVRIFLQDGHADGVKIISKSKWTGRGLVIPRTSFSVEKEREELNAPGIYLLVGSSSAESQPSLYIGAAKNVGHDLHCQDTTQDFWRWCIVFTAKDNSLCFAHFLYIEASLKALVECAILAKQVAPNCSADLALQAEDRAAADLFMEHMLSLCPLLGLKVFDEEHVKRTIGS